ncbi:MAG: hypothetical protein M1827_003919 [Pycnora praestabilis]|nr:MAG: hypothetical protein M1827_003919 [Pycnora praestabilis]
MVLSALLTPRSDSSSASRRSRNRSCPTSLSFRHGSSEDDSLRRIPFEEPFAGPLEPEDPDLEDLNDALTALAAIFPDIQLEVFREMLSTFDRESRLHVVTEAILKQKEKWVRGRWRVAGKEEVRFYPATEAKTNKAEMKIVPVEESFRSEGYKEAVKNTLIQEFRGLSRSTINAVLAERNHSYTTARPILSTLTSKSWRVSLSNFFIRKKPSRLAESHPLVVWRPVNCPEGEEECVPTMKWTDSAELNRELYDTILAPLLRKKREDQEWGDRDVAIQLNDEEAEELKAMHDCECCFTSTSFERLSACDTGGHFICFRCIRHAVNEALYGQGWARSIQHKQGSLRCIAPMSADPGDCDGCIPQALIRRALAEQKGGEEIWIKFEERLVGENLVNSKVALVRCPFCIYAEVDDLYLPSSERTWRLKRSGLFAIFPLSLLVFGTGLIPFLLPFVVIFSLFVFVFPSIQPLRARLSPFLTQAHTRILRRNRGLKFTCNNPLCGRSSCLSCNKEWHDIHICFESERVALRSTIERAMAEAVKRTCPRCNISFIKSSGCNKLTCVCGYQMCYVCRKEIGKESYRHFCEHFRPDPGKGCAECEKCDLYRIEDEEVVIRRAGEKAESEWREKEGVGRGWNWDGREKGGFGSRMVGKGTGGGPLWWYYEWRMLGLQEVLDLIVETLIE